MKQEKESKISGDGSFNKDEWMNKLEKVKTTEEFTALVEELPLADSQEPETL